VEKLCTIYDAITKKREREREKRAEKIAMMRRSYSRYIYVVLLQATGANVFIFVEK